MDYSDLPAMKTNPKFIFFTDFDGTITQQDSNDYLTDNLGYGQPLRKLDNKLVLNNEKSFRDSFQGMMDSVTTPYDQCIAKLLQHIELDKHFKEFYTWTRQNNIPVVVLSSGMRPIIKALLKHLIGDEADDIQVVSNNAVPKPGKSMNEVDGWTLEFHDETHFGHDKSLEIRKYKKLPDNERPTMFYAGDGVSDLSAAKETDLLFAKRGQDLVMFCVRENIPFQLFDDWSSILATVKEIVAGKTTVQEVSAKGVEEYLRESSKLPN